jgi:hypothetical protein
MVEKNSKQFSKELVVELINRGGKPEKKKFMFSSEEDSRVSAGVLKQNLLDWFDETSPLLENEPETDENRSYHLLGFDGQGKPSRFQDDETVDLKTYSRFEIAPRTTGGRNGGSVHEATHI